MKVSFLQRSMKSRGWSGFRGVRKITGSYYLFRHVWLSVSPLAWNNSAAYGRIFMRLDINLFSKICQENSNLIEIGHENRVIYTKTKINLWSYLPKLFVRWQTFQAVFVEKIKTYISCLILFFENHTIYETMRKNIVDWGRPAKNATHANCMLDT